MTKFSEALEKVVREELGVRKKVLELNLTGYEQVNKKVWIQELEELLSRAEVRVEMENE
jgi:hypothetical protein